ncbi:MAG: amidohydrolase family protein [Syntrophobacteraceae bacterium]
MCAHLHEKSGRIETGATSPVEVDWLLTDADAVITCDPDMRCIPCGAVAIEKDTLRAVGPTREVASIFRGRREISLKGFLVIPGLINTHCHAAMSLFRGLGDDLPLDRWLHELIFPAEAAHVNPEMVYSGTLLSLVEMLQNGITTFCDGYFFEEEAARAALDTGIRAVLGQGILDYPTPDQPDPARQKERAHLFLDSFPKDVDGRLRPSLFCHAPYTCGPDTLEWVKELCREREILFQMHLSETYAEVVELLKKYGERPVMYLDRLGVLDQKTLCAHAVWLEREEIDLLAERLVGISHNVSSNMKLASGVAPVPEMQAVGIRVSMGTDSSSSNNRLDLLRDMDITAKLYKAVNRDPVVCRASTILRMATIHGASVLGWEKEIGSLEVGKKADVVAIDLKQPHLTPIYDPVSHLVYSVRGSDVRHVWVNGRQVVLDGEIISVNTLDAMNGIKDIARKIRLQLS